MDETEYWTLLARMRSRIELLRCEKDALEGKFQNMYFSHALLTAQLIRTMLANGAPIRVEGEMSEAEQRLLGWGIQECFVSLTFRGDAIGFALGVPDGIRLQDYTKENLFAYLREKFEESQKERV